MNNEDSSYSIRDNGHIWKYAKQQSGAWRRVIDWVPSGATTVADATSPKTVEAGNH